MQLLLLLSQHILFLMTLLLNSLLPLFLDGGVCSTVGGGDEQVLECDSANAGEGFAEFSITPRTCFEWSCIVTVTLSVCFFLD